MLRNTSKKERLNLVQITILIIILMVYTYSEAERKEQLSKDKQNVSHYQEASTNASNSTLISSE